MQLVILFFVGLVARHVHPRGVTGRDFSLARVSCSKQVILAFHFLRLHKTLPTNPYLKCSHVNLREYSTLLLTIRNETDLTKLLAN